MKIAIRRSPVALLAGLILSGFLFASSTLAQPADPRIVGGHEADPGEWPWMVALVQRGANPFDGQFCGGSLIDRDWVLTAAHCVQGFSLEDFEVVAGIHNLAAPDPNYVRSAAAEVVVHPGWGSYYYENDIALLKLATPIDERPADGATLPIGFVDLAGADTGPLVGMMTTVTGWGNLLAQPDPGGRDYPETLYEVEVPVVSNAFCNNAYFGSITDSMLCAGVFRGGKDSCQGDSGGPLVFYDEGESRWEQAGIVSFGDGCGLPFVPGVYTRVSSFANWVHEVTIPFTPTHFAHLPAILDLEPVLPLLNGDFEEGPDAGWLQSSTQGWPIIVPAASLPVGITPHSGEWAVWLGGGDSEWATLTQEVTVPADQTYLNYQHWIVSIDYCGYDFVTIAVEGTVADTYDLCSSNETGGWAPHSADLSAYAGRTVFVEFIVSTDSSYGSSLFVDDVRFTAGTGSAAAGTPQPSFTSPRASRIPNVTGPLPGRRARMTVID